MLPRSVSRPPDGYVRMGAATVILQRHPSQDLVEENHTQQRGMNLDAAVVIDVA